MYYQQFFTKWGDRINPTRFFETPLRRAVVFSTPLDHHLKVLDFFLKKLDKCGYLSIHDLILEFCFAEWRGLEKISLFRREKLI